MAPKRQQQPSETKKKKLDLQYDSTDAIRGTIAKALICGKGCLEAGDNFPPKGGTSETQPLIANLTLFHNERRTDAIRQSFRTIMGRACDLGWNSLYNEMFALYSTNQPNTRDVIGTYYGIKEWEHFSEIDAFFVTVALTWDALIVKYACEHFKYYVDEVRAGKVPKPTDKLLEEAMVRFADSIPAYEISKLQDMQKTAFDIFPSIIERLSKKTLEEGYYAYSIKI
jgi:hypothetical protein